MATDSAVVSGQAIDQIMAAEVIANTAQGVLHKLEELERNRDHVLTRWVWELLQNARDAAVDPDTSLIASVVLTTDELVFRHTGAHFRISEMAHLIYHGSTKIEDSESIGQYGSGFLATHLLSPEIEIAGQLADGRHFSFLLRREVGSVRDLSNAMAQAQKDFKDSLSSETIANEFTTEFRYRLKDGAVDAVEEGIRALKQCAPFVVAFNKEFSSIIINSATETVEFKVVQRMPLDREGLQQVTVSQITDEVAMDRVIVLAQSGQTSVAFSLATDDDPECLAVGDVPRLFLGFPLIGTEDFSFPAVINSFDFTPTENRDGVYIARNRNENEANIENQAAIQTACKLLIDLLQFAASSGWRNAFHLAKVSAIPEKYWLNQDWLRACIGESLINEMRECPFILNKSGEIIAPEDVELPIADTTEGVESLYDLLDGWRGRCQMMPNRKEAVGWSDALKSWAEILDCDTSELDEVTYGKKLAIEVQTTSHDPSQSNPTYRLRNLQGSLKQEISAVVWLEQLHAFLIENGLLEVIRECRIVPSQLGLLRTLPNLHRDDDIDEELKKIADLMDGYREWNIRRELRDSRLTSVADDPGQGNWDNTYVVEELIKKLREQAEEAPNESFESFSKASVRLFTWVCVRKEWHLLRDFPVFAVEGDSESRRVIKLEHVPLDEIRAMAPVGCWNESLQPFSELFPRRHVIADDFFAATPDNNVWVALEEQRLCRREAIIKRQVYLDAFAPSEPLTDEDHKTSESVDVTDIGFLVRDEIGIMARVRQSQRLARIFWQFLTEWVIVHDPNGVEIQKAKCDCGDEHQYYSAKWLVPVQRNRWVPLGSDKRGPVTAQSLADLLRGGDWEPSSLNENPAAVKLLEAIGITRFDLVRAFVAASDDERGQQDSILTGILDAAAGQTDRLNHARQYIEYLSDDEALPQVVEDRQKQRQVVRENQNLGKQVEDLVRESLEKEGFEVRRKPIGSDFEIEHDALEGDVESGIEVKGLNRTWLVEVKATRGQAVRMTEKQANTAREEGNRFLLCVVPLEDYKPILTLEEVSTKMRFVQNIGPLVAPLCDNLDEFREMREDITTSDASTVQLIVDAGTVRVQVAAPVWEDQGFQLEDLLSKLLESMQY